MWKSRGISIDSLSFIDGKYDVFLSNGEAYSINGTVPVAKIDERGFWSVNGIMIESPVEISNINVTNDENTDTKCIVEDYTSWLFYFQNGNSDSLTKSLFSFDPDLEKKGINHRGYNQIAPENTLPAFRLSRLMGFRYVETDIQFTKDDVPVLLHDPTVDRTSNGEGKLNDLTWEEVRKLDFGSWKSTYYSDTKIPSLEEFLALCQEIGLIPYIELKTGTRQQIDQVVSMVNRYGFSETATFISFAPACLAHVSSFLPTATLGFLTGTPLKDSNIQTALSLQNGQNQVFIDGSDYSDEAVLLCKEANLPLEVWTVNSQKTIRDLPTYVSGVTSDRFHAGRVVGGAK